MENIKVRKATRGDVNRIIQSMVRAFDDDPLINWLVSDKWRKKGFERLFKMSLNVLSMPFDEVLTTDDCAGSALWIASKDTNLGILKQLSLLPTLVGISGFKRVKRFISTLDALDKAHPKDKHYYLLFIGVDPDYRKRGIGGTLMKPVLDRCDAEGCGAYLENTNIANEAFYKSHGFEITQEINPGLGGPPLIGMWRKPKV